MERLMGLGILRNNAIYNKNDFELNVTKFKKKVVLAYHCNDTNSFYHSY